MSVPSKRVRVLIVDDSATARLALRSMLATDPAIEVVGEARDGGQAIRMVGRLRPDLVLMDITMEGMDGLTATRQLMAVDPRPILIVSDHIGRRADLTFEALEAGALDVLAKPTARDIADEEAHRRLQRLVRLAAEVPVVTRRRTLRSPGPGSPPAASNPSRHGGAARRRVALVCIGASTGGPPALATLLAPLAPSPGFPILIVQHIAPTFTESLARWLAHSSGLPVEIATHGSTPRPGGVYIAPGGAHLELRDGRLALSNRPRDSGHRPSVDVLFESVAESPLVRGTLAVLLTGMGKDGARGLKSIREAGGWTIAQDEESSVVYGMPKEAVAIGGASEVLSLGAIADRLATASAAASLDARSIG